MQEQLGQENKRIPSWSSYILTSIILFPMILGLNMIYKLPGKKTIMRSVADALLLNAFALEFDRNVRKTRNVLINGTLKEKKRLISFEKYSNEG